MKRLIPIICVYIFCFNSILSQITGTGTEGNPFTGTTSIGGNFLYPSSGNPYPDEDGVPTIWANNIIIRSGSTLTVGPEGILRFSVGSNPLTIESTGTFVIQPGACVTVNEILNNGSLIIESSAGQGGSASLLLNVYSGNRNTEVQLYLAGGAASGTGYRWHYISVPISNIQHIAFHNYEPAPPFDLAQYVEPLATTDNMAGWVTYDGYQYSSGNTLGYTFSTMTLGRGYNFYSGESPVVRLYTSVSEGRLINLSNIDYPVTCNSGSLDTRGWNLIGNPFTSSIDWDLIVGTGIQNVDNAIYFTINNTVSAYVSGLSTTGATSSIPPMQGFFVHATGASSIPLYTNARMHNPWQMRYKKSAGEYKISSDTISFIRLNIENEKENNDLIVRFNRSATSSFDKIFDAYKLNKTSGTISAWTKMGNVDYSINGLPFPDSSVEIPVSINVSAAGIFKLSSKELRNLDNYSVTLKDLLTNISVDLNKGEILEFNVPAGMIEDRFVLSVTNLTLGESESLFPEKKFSIYSSSGIVNILCLSDDFSNYQATVNVYDLTGRKVFQQSNFEWNGKGDLKQIAIKNTTKGLYIVEIKAGNKRYVEKIFIIM